MADLGVVVDGRVDRSKLDELLAWEAEQEPLDFKASIDFRAPKDQVEFVKDLLAMMSLRDGGYLVVGVDNSGRAAEDQQPIVPAHFDSATLLQKVAAYVDATTTIVSAVHTIKAPSGTDWDVALVFAGPPPSLFPLVVKKQGEFEQQERDKTRTKVKFRPGDVIVREGTTTAVLRHEFWPRLLDRYTEKVREDARRDSDALIHRFVQILNEQPNDGLYRSGGGVAQPPPIDLDMDLPTLAIAADSLIESGNLSRLDRFLIQVAERLRSAASSEEYAPARAVLDRAFALASSAVLYGSDEQLERILQTLFDYYNAVPRIGDAVTNETPREQRRAGAWLEVLAHLYVLGALAVRRKKWAQLRALTLRRYSVHESYGYASWLRHAITSAARAGLLKTAKGEGGDTLRGAPVISRALQLATTTAELRPDLVSDPGLQPRLLDSLCEFDIIWCIVAQTATDRPDGMDFYPSSSELDQVHANGAFVLIASDAEARSALFPGQSDQQIGTAMLYVWARANRQSWEHDGWWTNLATPAAQWAESVDAEQPGPI